MTPVYNVFKNEDGSYFHERVCCLALCKDGFIRSISVCEFFDLAEESSNFVGSFNEESLTEYPTRKN
jgi:hypothetical protein